jgi:hypothetical protein
VAPGKGISEEGGERPAQSETARQRLFSFAVCQVRRRMLQYRCAFVAFGDALRCL